jgi:hypothetical protein
MGDASDGISVVVRLILADMADDIGVSGNWSGQGVYGT